MRKAWFLAAVLLGLGFGATPADAQTYPDRVIKMIVPFIPGGPVDAVARVIAQHMQLRIGQSVIIENRPGGGTTIGTKAVINAPPDGYTLLFTGPQLAYLPFLYPNLDIDPVKSLAPVATVVSWSHVMVVAPNVGTKTVAELVAYAKANPGKLVFGFGLATTPHILGETFKRVTATDIVSVSYRGGEQARADLLGGRVHAAARLHRTGAQPGLAGRSHHDRKRVARGRVQPGCVAGNHGSGRHACRRDPDCQCRRQRQSAIAGVAGHAGAARLRSETDDAAGVLRVSRGRAAQMAPASPRSRSEARVTPSS
jgi:Tripartite tricarboxylate transporter family receptor